MSNLSTTKGTPIQVFYNDGSVERSNLVQGIPMSGGNYAGIAVIPYGESGIAFSEHVPNADSINPASVRAIDTANFPFLYDPVADRYDRQRANHSGTVLASAARTASVNSADLINYNARGVHVIINVSTYPAAASIVPTIQGYDPLSATYYDLLIGSAIVATGYTVLKIYPGIGEIANGAASDILPRNWRVTMTHADADSITYSVGYQLVL